MPHGTQPTVLLIEADPSLRRLITLGLQYRGMHVLEASSFTYLPPLEAQPPNLLILDVDGSIHSDWSLLTTVQTHPSLSTLPVITLAWEYPAPPVSAAVINQQPAIFQSQVTCLTKPFDARALHTTIEQLLIATALTQSSLISEHPVALSTTTTAPSIWPIITAAGLLLAFIGLMSLFPITILGLCIVLIALLWWTLGSHPQKEPLPISLSS